MASVPITLYATINMTEDGDGDVFKAGINYINVPSTSTPEEFGTIVNRAFDNMSESEYNRIVQNNYDLMKHFDRFHVAEEYIKLIKGEPCGWYGKFETGTPTSKFIAKAKSQWYGTGDKRTFAFPAPKKYSASLF